MRIQYIVHEWFDYTGILESWARQNKFSEKIWRPYLNEEVPSPLEFDLLIILGGPQSAVMMEEPYLKLEVSLIQMAIDLGKPTLGFCLGAQLIGIALGARAEPSPNREIGVFPIRLTDEGIKDPIFKGIPSNFPVTHWHDDMPGLTPHAKVLAFSEGCPRQVICYGPTIYGFQCHPESTRQNLEEAVRGSEEDFTPGMFVQSKEKFLENDFEKINHMLIQVLDNFISLKL